MGKHDKNVEADESQLTSVDDWSISVKRQKQKSHRYTPCSSINEIDKDTDVVETWFEGAI